MVSVLGFSRETKPIRYRENMYKKRFLIGISLHNQGTKKSHDLSSASRRMRKSGDVIQSESKGLRPKRANV